MKRISVGTVLAVVAGLAIISQPALAKEPAVPDVALHQGGVLQGQLVDESGNVKAATPVVVTQKGKVVVIAKTDKQGRFAIRGMRAGVYQIESQHSQDTYRLWAPQTAPPAAKAGVLIVGDESLVRAQSGGFLDIYGPAIRGAIAGGLLTGGAYWALDQNSPGS